MNIRHIEALKLALEWLEYIDQQDNDRDFLGPEECCALDDTRNTIREALAEQPAQQQEPVVWMYVNKSTHETKFHKHMRDFVDHSLWSEVPLYGEPLANHELQCVCGAVWLGDEMVHLPDKHPPASKPWVGLTEEERNAILDREFKQWWSRHDAVCRAIEAKLREKNA